MPRQKPLSGRLIDAPEGIPLISRTDPDGRIVYANQAFCTISGWSSDEILGKQHNIVRHPDVPKLLYAKIWRQLKAGLPTIDVLKNRCKNGDAYWVESHISPIVENGRVTGYMSVRHKASPAQIAAAEQKYAEMNRLPASNRPGALAVLGEAFETNGKQFLPGWFNHLGLPYKFLAAALLVASFIVLLGGSLLAIVIKNRIDSNLSKHLQSDLQLIKSNIAVRLDQQNNELSILSNRFGVLLPVHLGEKYADSAKSLETLAHSAGAEALQGASGQLVSQNSRASAAIYVATSSGFSRIWGRFDVPENSFLFGNSPAAIALLAGKPYSDTQYQGKQFEMRYFLPLRAPGGEIIGATLVTKNLDRFVSDLRATTHALRADLAGDILLIYAGDGINFATPILVSSRPVDEPILAENWVPAALGNALKKINHGELTLSWQNKALGQEAPSTKRIIFEKIEPLNTYIAAMVDTDTSFAEMRKIITWLALGCLLIFAMVGGATFWLLQKLVLQPIQSRILPTLDAMAAGKLSNHIDINGHDEIAKVNQQLECLQNRLAFDLDQGAAYRILQEKIEVELRDMANARTTFLANMSHEIRTPLNAVIGLTYLLLEKCKLNYRERDYVKRINTSGKHLLQLVNDILDFSKIDAGMMSLEKEVFKLDEVLDNLSTLFRGRVQEKQLVLEYIVDPDVPSFFCGDTLRLSQILINLVGNAIKFTPKGSIIVFIHGKKMDNGKYCLNCRVQDSGIGMTPEQRAKLFKAFSQGNQSTSRNYGGTGLGLVISKQLVELMGGHIWVDSRPNVGSIFGFDVQLETTPNLNLIKQRTEIDILVVDDSELARTVLSQMLKKQGCRVSTANSGDQAIDLIRERLDKPFDIVILDLVMPGMDGIELSRHLRALLGQRSKLVLATSSDIHATPYEGLFENFDETLEKPITASGITDLIVRLTEGSADSSVPVDNESLPLDGLRILVAEDVETNQVLMNDLLDALGASVEIAGHGEAALMKLELFDGKFDLILMDVQMPVLDGLEATRRIRAGRLNPEIPIIALTANGAMQERQKCLTAGMNDFLNKPLEVAKLIQVLSRWKPQSLALAPAPATPTIAKSAAVAAKAIASTPDLPPFPAIAGLDTAETLSRMDNRRPLYEKILIDFCRRFAGEAEKIKAALANHDLETAARLAHSLKGVSATIGADQLSKIAADLEIDIEKEEDDVTEQVAAVEQILNDTIATIQKAFPEKTVSEMMAS